MTIGLSRIMLFIENFKTVTHTMGEIMRRFHLCFVVILILGSLVYGQYMDFGLHMSISMPTAGKFVSSQYAGTGGWIDNTQYYPPNVFEVPSMVAEWEISPGMQVGGGGFFTLWFKQNLGARLNLDYSINSGVKSKAFLDYSIYNGVDLSTTSFTAEYGDCREDGSLETFKINPALQFSFGPNPFHGFGVFVGPTIFVDNYRVFMDIPIIETWDDALYYYYGATYPPIMRAAKHRSARLSARSAA